MYPEFRKMYPEFSQNTQVKKRGSRFHSTFTNACFDRTRFNVL